VLAPPSHMTTDGDHSLHQKVFRRFTFRHFDISVVKCFDTPSHEPQIFGVSHFRHFCFTFRHFCVEVFRHSKSRTPKFSAFRISAFRHFCVEVFRHSKSRTPKFSAFRISQLRDSCDEESRLFMLRSSETPKSSQINGPQS
jgi:hypothetical protein